MPPANGDDSWHVTLKPFLWAAALDGKVGVAPLPPIDVDMSFRDILEDLEFGLMLAGDARKGDSDWALMFDSLYIDLDSEYPGTKARIRQLMLEGDVAWRPGDQRVFELLGGARYWSMEADVEILGSQLAKRKKNWLDPLVGGRGTIDLSKHGSLALRGDFGGFGVGSDLTWQVLGYFRYVVGKHAHLAVGYRHMHIDYEDSTFSYDAALSGPLVGFSWRF